MDWRDELAAQLPAPRDGEPASLRQDIVDELSDHLACALRRELLRTRDEDEATCNVLRRFGDPDRTGRQLWFDAMKERIMSQRITLVLMSIMTLACLVACGLVWIVVQRGRAVDVAILEQLKTLAEREATSVKAEAPVSLEWNPVKVHLVVDEQFNSPAVGYTATLSGFIFDSSMKTSASEKSDAEGIADLGLVRPGRHTLSVKTPWGEEHGHSIVVKPGQSPVETVVCPLSPPAEADIAISVDWPEDLRQAGYWIVCGFSRSGREIAGKSWNTHSPSRTVVVTSTGELQEYLGEFNHIRPFPSYTGQSVKYTFKVALPDTTGQKGEPLRWTAGNYELRGVAVVASPSDRDGQPANELAVVAPDFTRSFLRRVGVPLRSLNERLREVTAVFDAVARGNNLWKVSLSEENWFECRVHSAIASLSEEAFEPFNRHDRMVHSAASCFVELDRDHNGELSEPEYVQIVKVSSKTYAMQGELPDGVSPPLSRDWFVQYYLSQYRSRSSSPSLIGPRPPSRTAPKSSRPKPEAVSKPKPSAP